MKRLQIGIIVLALLLPVLVGWDTSAPLRVTTERTADARVFQHPKYISAIVFATDGTNAVTVDLYDNNKAVAAGRNLLPTTVIPTSATLRSGTISFGKPGLPVWLGLFLDLTTAGTTSYIVYYYDYN